MLIDGALQYSSSQAVTTSAASSNVVNHTASGNGKVNNPTLVVQVKTAATASTSATVTFTLQTSDSSDFSTYNTLGTSDAIGYASLTAGSYPLVADIQRYNFKKYSRVYFTVSNGPLTAGAFSAFIAY